jgi:hypothetical protein
MSAYDEATAREYKRAAMHCKRIVRLRQELAEIPLPKTAEQLLLVFQVAANAVRKQGRRRLRDVLDIMTTQVLPAEEGKLTDGERFKLLSRIEYHKKLAAQAVNDGDEEHGLMHETIAAQLRGFMRHPPRCRRRRSGRSGGRICR